MTQGALEGLGAGWRWNTSTPNSQSVFRAGVSLNIHSFIHSWNWSCQSDTGSTRRVRSWLEKEVYSSSYRLGAGLVSVTLGALEELGAGWRWKCILVHIDWELVLSQ